MEARKLITWLAAKAFFKKAWVWLKHNWYVPLVIVYTLILYFLLRKKGAALAVLEIRDESYKKQIEAINKIHKEEIEKRDEILKKYNVILNELEEKYKKDNIELDKKKKVEVKKLVEEYHENPNELAKLLAERYGLEYVE